MDHDALKERIFALYDGELDAAARREAEHHLESCAECSRFYEDWIKTAKAFFPKPEARGSEFFVRRVMDRVHEAESPAQETGRGLFLRWLVPALGVAVVFFLLLRPTPVPLSMEALLVNSQDSGFSMLVGGAPTTDETLEFIMEGGS